ncbi:hypothetical protein [Pseudomonas chlororaphis]|uniref:hypothetical protein n=1 Tax=Pseudomonas chlororaphis TaxID=587753 RepID=UPI001184B0DD|nr:hypothetical protein [Pseudomonas chlororaphis]
MDLVIPSLPKLPIWPAGRGLVIVEGERADYYNAQGSRPVERSHIDFDNDIVLRRVTDNHYNVLLPSGERDIVRDGDCLFRAVITSWNRGGLKDAMTDAFILELREHVADYISQNWDDFKDFVIQDGVPLAGDSEHRGAVSATSNAGGGAAMEMFHQASRIGKASFIPMLMAQVEALVVPALEAIRGTAFTEKDMHGLAVVLRLVNRTIADAPPAERAEWIERCLQDLFSSDAKHPVSKAEAILAHRNSPALNPVVNELMTFIESTAQQLKGDALARFGQLLGVDIAVDGTDRGIARFFSRESATSGPINQFRARFESLREEFGMSF